MSLYSPPQILEYNFDEAPDFTKVQVIVVDKSILDKHGNDEYLVLTLTDPVSKVDFKKNIRYTEIPDNKILLELTSLGDKKLVVNELMYMMLDFEYKTYTDALYNSLIYKKYHQESEA